MTEKYWEVHNGELAFIRGQKSLSELLVKKRYISVGLEDILESRGRCRSYVRRDDVIIAMLQIVLMNATSWSVSKY